MGDRVLHILRTEPDATQRVLMDGVSEGRETLEFPLFGDEEGAGYERLIDLIFEYDRVVTWW
ncbi:MAG: hypothetical protein JRH06_07160 [Deltaproteobacteria bacterium]|nr:hypothetical protein [Deltaproteobacteria bacterium]MBW2137321.1 hypothetical protein [Deltaproteobacteria bacterium]